MIAFMWWVQTGRLVTVHADGIVRRGRFGTSALRWDEITAYRTVVMDTAVVAAGQGGLVGVLVLALIRAAAKKKGGPTVQSLKLVGRDKDAVKLGQIVYKSQELLDELLRFATERLYPPALAAYEAGQPVWFGNHLGVRRGEGITHKGAFGKLKVLPFDQVERAAVEGPIFQARARGKKLAWASVQLAAMDSPHVAERLIAHALATHAAAATTAAAGPAIAGVTYERR